MSIRSGGVQPSLPTACLPSADVHEAMLDTLALARSSYPTADLREVKATYEAATHWYGGRRHSDGEPFLVRAVEVARIVAGLGLPPSAVCVALLQDAVDDRAVSTWARARRGDDVLAARIADRLYTMRNRHRLPPAEQIQAAHQARELVVPVARQLGLVEVEHELLGLTEEVLERSRTRPGLTIYRGVRGTAVWIVWISKILRIFGLGGALFAIAGPGTAPTWIAGAVAGLALALLAALLFGRSDAPTRRLADLVSAWRRGS